ncbi:MAG: helix-turn-helix domain-containing protein [Conexivisphaerales archaeon]
MELTRTYKFRTYPDTKRQEEIEMQLNLSKDFYNKLEKAKDAYKKGQNIHTKVHSMRRK